MKPNSAVIILTGRPEVLYAAAIRIVNSLQIFPEYFAAESLVRCMWQDSLHVSVSVVQSRLFMCIAFRSLVKTTFLPSTNITDALHSKG